MIPWYIMDFNRWVDSKNGRETIEIVAVPRKEEKGSLSVTWDRGKEIMLLYSCI